MSFSERSGSQVPKDPSISAPLELDVIREIERFNRIRQGIMANEYFDKTIFPEFLNRFALNPNNRCNPLVFHNYWPEIGRRSAVSDLIWNMTFVEIVKTQAGYEDVYKGQAIAIEVNPDGILIFHSNKDPKESGLILPEQLWINDENIQKSFFDIAFLDSKPITYSEGLNGPTIHD